MAFWRRFVICSHFGMVRMVVCAIPCIHVFEANEQNEKVVNHLAITK